jgi:hypothetical protein
MNDRKTTIEGVTNQLRDSRKTGKISERDTNAFVAHSLSSGGAVSLAALLHVNA